jgi:hypothetical protein
MAVGNASHDKVLALNFELVDGPEGLACKEGNGPAFTETVGPGSVVFAGDVGDANGCEAFSPGSMTGAIALISRGDCLFTDKAANAAAAGAEAMVVFNSVSGQPVNMAVADSTIPSCMITQGDGLQAQTFVQSTPGATGKVNYPRELLSDKALGDVLSGSSSRGPVLPPVEDILKPNVIAPGSQIFAAWKTGQEFAQISGTSMSSPHVAGAGALIRAVHPDWSVSQIFSAIETTATTVQAVDFDYSAVGPHDVGSGRPQLGIALNAGLSLEVSTSDFLNANPALAGEPGSLNLPTMVEDNCGAVCTFTRTVTDQVGGGSWTAASEDFPGEVLVTVVPDSFELSDGDSQELEIRIELQSSSLVGQWVSGKIRLSSDGRPDQLMQATVFSDGGELPSSWVISDAGNGGWKEFPLDGLVSLPDATYTSGGLVRPSLRTEVLPTDPTDDEVYDGTEGVFTEWVSLPQGGMWLRAETLASTAEDLDLFVGRDINGNRTADEFEELCSSTSPNDLEECNLYQLEPGEYWILVQNWDGTLSEGDEATLRSAVIVATDDSNLHATGPGRVDSGAEFKVRVSWDNVDAVPGEEFLGAVGIGSNRENAENIGVIPLRFNRTAVEQAMTFPLMNGITHGLAVAAGSTHDRMFIDLPPGASKLTVSASGADAEQSDNLNLQLVRKEFSDGLAEPPFASPAGGGTVVVSASGGGGEGPVAVAESSLEPGRWYAVLTNDGSSASSVSITATAEFDGEPVAIHRGLWEPNSRPGINQGYEYHDTSINRFLIWYTFDEDGQPIWFYSEGPNPSGNIWTADVMRLTNDGANQQLSRVGMLSVTHLAENDQLFSFTLYGESGTDRLQPLGIPECPEIDGVPKSYNGQWFRGVAGLGGASIHANEVTQAQVHFIYDDEGNPRWLVAQDPENNDPYDPVLPFLQFTGFCATCETIPRSFETMGTLERHFDTESEGEWTLDYELLPPLSGSAQRIDQIIKLTETIDCP